MAVVRGSEHSDAKRFLILHIGSPLSRRLSRLPPSGRDYEQTTFRISGRGLRPALVRRTPPTRPDPAQNDPRRNYLTLRRYQADFGRNAKAISPFGGLASFISFLGQIGFARQVQQHLPFAEATSNNAIPLAHSLTAFLMSVVVGAQRFAHSEWLRADRVLHAMLGMGRFPSDDTIRNFFLRFTQAQVETFWRPLWRWLLRLLACPKTGFALDLDSTVFCREGQQEGVRKGFNPRRQGRSSHHPLLAALAEAPFILHGWLRSGNTGAARGVVPFLQEALALLPEGAWIRTVRADSGFFDGTFLDFLEERGLLYVVVARLTSTLKRKCAGIKEWTPIDEHHDAGEFTLKLLG
ncbi:MAG: transposase [Limisphaerales bacterium]